MGIEILACLMLAGSGFGLVGTFLTWVHLDGRRTRSLGKRLDALGAWAVTHVQVEDSTTPVRIELRDGPLFAILTVATHGVMNTWRVRMTCARMVIPRRMQILSVPWARAAVGHHDRAHQEVTFGWRENVFRVFSEQPEDAVAWLNQRGVAHALDHVEDAQHVGSVTLEDGAVEIELEREALGEQEALCALDSAARLAHAVLGVEHVSHVGEVRGGAGGLQSGAPMGIPRGA